MSDSRDLVHELADHAANLQYGDLDGNARECAKKSLLDTIGVSLAASGLEPAARVVLDIVRESGGAPQCSLVGFGGKAPALSAALANGALAHCLDYDDQTPWGQHAASSIVPAVLALAERQRGVSGMDLIAAIAAGQNISVACGAMSAGRRIGIFRPSSAFSPAQRRRLGSSRSRPRASRTRWASPPCRAAA